MSQPSNSDSLYAAPSSPGQVPRLTYPTSFLDLPYEIRNVIYPSALHYPSERRLALKRKGSPNGTVQIKEQAPPLYHAIPLLRNEVLATYYAQNQFRVPLVTRMQRDTFRTWVAHRGKLLRDLKALKLALKIPFMESTLVGMDVTSNLRLTLADDGELAMRYSCRFVFGCACWLVPYMEKDVREWGSSTDSTTDDDNNDDEQDGTRQSETIVAKNAVLAFALKVCALLDVKHHEPMPSLSWRWSTREDEKPCPRCGEIAALGRGYCL